MLDLVRTWALGIAALPVLCSSATGQVMRDLPPVELEYQLVHGTPPAVVGTTTAAFKTIASPRGDRLEIRVLTKYTLARKPPYEYEEEATLLCDAKGVTRFDTVARALGDERSNTGVRVGKDYQVTTVFRGKKRSETITAGVQRTNFGLFAAGYLPDDLGSAEFYEDFPLLYPVAATHMPRHLIREGTLPFEIAKGRAILTTNCRLEAPDQTKDRVVNAAEGHRILLRMEDQSNLGTITYELIRVNGKPLSESEFLK